MVAIGGDLEPGTVLDAYRRGLFPDARGRRARVVVARSAWRDPARRVPPEPLAARRHPALRGASEQRVRGGDARLRRPEREHGWIDESFVAAYCELHELGWAHSVETWRDDELVGGLYGLRIGRLFAGESMFHRVMTRRRWRAGPTVELLRIDGATLFDVQWTTPHLQTLGAIDITRAEYLRQLAAAVAR